MDEIELIQKMNILGTLMKEYEIVKATFEENVKSLTEDIEALKAELKTEFLSRKEGLSSDLLVVKYRKGAVRWDTDLLKVYAKTHPEMEVFRKTGEPTVAFSLPKEEE